MTDLRAARAAAALGLIASMWISSPLWLSARVYPFTPVFAFWKPLPPPLDRVVLAAMLLLLVAIAVAPRARYATAGFLLLAGMLAMADQSRWQPWFYLYCFLLLAGSGNAARLVLASTYFWSGLQKINAGFLHDTFPAMVAPIAKVYPMVSALGAAVPAIEIAIAIALLNRRARRSAAIAAAATHLFVLAAIGPWGVNVNPVVWPWNIAMICLVAALFWNSQEPWRDILWTPRSPLHGAVLVLFTIAPLLSFFNLWDAYLSSALYSSNKNTATIRMADSVADRLPDEVQDHISSQGLDVNDWSFDALRVPAYPEVRVFRNVAKWVCGYARDPAEVTLVVHHRKSLFGGGGTSEWSCRDLEMR